MKRKYKKPEINKVKLVPEEAVLTNCKVTFSGSQGGNKCLENGCLNKDPGS